MRLLTFSLINLVSIFFCLLEHLDQADIENRRWVLEKIIDLQSGTVVCVEEYHYLEFRNDRIIFSEDCNVCSAPYQFISKNEVSIDISMCTRKNCINKDAIRVSYIGKYSVWIERDSLIMQSGNWDYVYK